MNKVTKEHVEAIMEQSQFQVVQTFDKTTIVSCKLPNGFVITESSSCVDSANYDVKIGIQICKDRIMNKIWELEGYVLQTKLSA